MEEKSFYINAQTFCWLVEENNFSKVGRIHQLSQSTISRRILSLEEELGYTLIRRNTRSLEITTDGYEFYNFFNDYHKQLYYDIENFKNSNNSKKNKENIRISMPMGAVNQIVLPFLPNYLNNNQHIYLQIFYENREIDLIKEHYHLAIVRQIPDNTNLKSIKLFETKMNMYCTQEYINRYGKPENINDLIENHHLIGGLEDTLNNNINNKVYHHNKEYSFNTNLRIKVNNLEPAIKFATGGYFIIPGVDFMYKDQLSDGTLIKVLPDYQFAKFELFLISENDHRNTTVTEFSDFIISCFKNKSYI